MDQILNIADWYLFQGVGGVIGFQRVVGPRLMGLTPDEAICAGAVPAGHRVFRALEGLLGDNDWMAGETFSLADILVACQLDLLIQAPEWALFTADTPRLSAWRERAAARPSLAGTTWDKVEAMAAA
jgi:glutathione S-transferase